MTGIWREPFTVRWFDGDPDQRLSMPALCRYAQEGASHHATALGVSVNALLEQGQTWLLMQMDVWPQELPGAGTRCVVETWPSTRSAGVRAQRLFRVMTEEGDLVAVASSIWTILDVNTRKFVKMPKHLLDACVDDPEGFALPETRKQFGVPQGSPVGTVRAGWHDLDWNDHVNNTKYIEWLLDTIEPAMWRSRAMESFHVKFQAEAKWNDVLEARMSQEGNESLLSLMRDEATVASGVAVWRNE